jgi:hypothetical protein
MKTVEPAESGPRIIKAFQGYTPPFNATKAIRRMLKVVPPKFLWGLHTVVLTNVGALSRNEREQKGRTRINGEALGYYNQEWNGQPARITILVDNIQKESSRRWLRLGFFRGMELSKVFFHELGHHIHRVHRPKYEEREQVAEKYRAKLSAKYMSSRYWYFPPVAVPIVLLDGIVKDFAKHIEESEPKFSRFPETCARCCRS